MGNKEDVSAQLRIAQHGWKSLLDDTLSHFGIDDSDRRDVFIMTIGAIGCQFLLGKMNTLGSKSVSREMSSVFSALIDRGVEIIREGGGIPIIDHDSHYKMWSN